MKKVLSVVLSLVLVGILSTGPVLAKPGNENGGGKKVIQSSGSRNQVKVSNQIKVQSQVLGSLKQLRKKVANQEMTTASFSDVKKHWAKSCIEDMASIGLFKGFPDGTFKANKEITQAEIIALLMRIAPVNNTTSQQPEAQTQAEDTQQTSSTNTTDETTTNSENQPQTISTETNASTGTTTNEVQNSDLTNVPKWAREAAGQAAKQGIINLNRFHSAIQASRAQTAVWIAKALGLTPVDVTSTPFKDGILISPEDAGYIMALYKEGIMKGTPDGKFNPNSAITRAEMATIMARILAEAENDQQTQTTEQNQNSTGETNETSNTNQTEQTTTMNPAGL